MNQIREAALAALEKARRFYGLEEPVRVEIDCSLRGKMAGQAGWRVRRVGAKVAATDFRLRFNLEAYHLHPEEMLTDTVPHEVAHLIVAARFGPGCRPHGPEWQAVMRDCFGLNPKRTHSLPLTAARRVERDFIYACKCREHRLTSIRHQRIRRGKTLYRCNSCGELLSYQDQLL
ncbi:SprT family zinc-dependent metalloprotease [Geoalkalibacter halelectricus]|uniref:SprT-like domain-containing protein n=1 Tax=Geoalkalibacter halelectricus TaxID=2847045 RepID=A0ABY5ZK29_9BACT|nr:SprT-like domain-containing protein [Geoalkalibacter halelectricus]MDO3376859.1 SprT-like domain-containing protein [Geoalkalibacter halelectricus]UWZ79076.1 SprT-like domain-containing protein [Geoalkalibacter halelectricus]